MSDQEDYEELREVVKDMRQAILAAAVSVESMARCAHEIVKAHREWSEFYLALPPPRTSLVARIRRWWRG